jgi:hypothetical protein
MLKILQTLPPNYFNILKSYLQCRHLVVTYKNSTSPPVPMLSGVPQGSVLRPFLYTLYMADIPQSPNTALSTFTDDTAILSNHSNRITASTKLQTHLQSIEKWTRKWKIKINKEISKHVTFSVRRGSCPHLTYNRIVIPQADTVKYMGLHLDRRLTWNYHSIMETPGPQNQRLTLDHRQTLSTLAEQPTTNLQGNTKTGLDLRYRAMGRRLTNKYS